MHLLKKCALLNESILVPPTTNMPLPHVHRSRTSAKFVLSSIYGAIRQVVELSKVGRKLL